LQFAQVPVVDRIRDWHVLFVPAIVARLVPADPENCRAPGIESVEHPIGTPFVLDAQFPHVAVSGCRNAGRMGHSQRRPQLLQHAHGKVDTLLLGCAQVVPPVAELKRELYFPGHSINMSCAAL
jgi:hypothetical protein